MCSRNVPFPGLKGPADGRTGKSVAGVHTGVTARCREDGQCIQAEQDHTKTRYEKHAEEPQQNCNAKLWKNNNKKTFSTV